MVFWVTPYQATLLLNRNVKKIYIQTFEIIAEKRVNSHFWDIKPSLKPITMGAF
jgi:hypothetical protein